MHQKHAASTGVRVGDCGNEAVRQWMEKEEVMDPSPRRWGSHTPFPSCPQLSNNGESRRTGLIPDQSTANYSRSRERKYSGWWCEGGCRGKGLFLAACLCKWLPCCGIMRRLWASVELQSSTGRLKEANEQEGKRTQGWKQKQKRGNTKEVWQLALGGDRRPRHHNGNDYYRGPEQNHSFDVSFAPNSAQLKTKHSNHSRPFQAFPGLSLQPVS